MDTVSIKTPDEVNVKLKKRRRGKREEEANDGCVVRSVDHEDKNVHDFESGKNGMIAKDFSQDNLMELDSIAKLSHENPKSDLDSNSLQQSNNSRKRRRKKAKKEATSEVGTECMDRTIIISNLCLEVAGDAHAIGETNNATDESLEFGRSTGKGSKISLSSPLPNLAIKDAKLVNNQITSSPSVFKGSTNNICHQFLQERVESGNRIVDQEDKNMDDFEIGKNGMRAKACSQDNVKGMDCTAKLSQENPKSDMGSITNPLEQSNKSRKRKRQKAKKKAASNLGPESVDLTNIVSNLSLEDASDAHAGGKINNATDGSLESGLSVGKGSTISLSSPLANLVIKDVKFVNNQIALSPRLLKASTNNICHQFLPERVESVNGIMDQKDKKMHDFGNGKNGMVAKACSQDNLMASDFTAKLSQENSKSDMDSIPNPLEQSNNSRKKRKKKAKKKAASQPGPECMDQTNVISNLSLEDARNAHAGGKINNATEESQESRQFMGKGSLVSLSSPLANLAIKDVNLVTNQIASSSGLFKVSTNNICHPFLQERVESGTGVVDQRDKNVHDFENGKNGLIAKVCSKDNLMELDSTTKLSHENPKSDMHSTTNPSEQSNMCRKKRRKKAKKKAASNLGPVCMDQRHIVSNLSLKDASDAHACGKINNATDESQETRQSMGKGSLIPRSSPLANLAIKDVNLVTNQIASSPSVFKVSTNNICHQFLQERVESGTRVVDQRDKNVHDFGNGKTGMIAKVCSKDNLMELDSTAKLSEENPKSDMDSTTNPSEQSKKSKKRRKKSKKKTATNLGPECMDQRNIVSNLSLEDASDAHAGGQINNATNESEESRQSTGRGSLISLSSPSANLAIKDANFVTNQTASSPSVFKVPTNNICHQSLQERVESGTRVVDQRDKNVHDFENGKTGMIARVSSKDNLMELDSTAKLSEENPKSDMDSTTNPSEQSNKSKKRRKKAKKKAATNLGPECMDQRNFVSNLSLEDVRDACAGGQINNATNESQEPRQSMGRGSLISLSSPLANLAIKDANFVTNQTASSPSVFEVPTNNICHQSLQERVESGTRVVDQRDKNVHDFENGKNGLIAKVCSKDNLMELDSTAKLSEENPKSDMDSAKNPSEQSNKSREKRRKKAKKKIASNLGTECMDQRNIVSNLSLEDASDAHAGGQINNATDESQESGQSTGKGSLISLSSPVANLAIVDAKLVNDQIDSSPSLVKDKVSTDNISHQFLQEMVESGNKICNKEVMQHRSSEVLYKAKNDLLVNTYQIPQRRKLLILDVNGLLADIVKPPPRGFEADTRILGRAIFKRPFYIDFLNFCLERFGVGIWSSRTKKVLDKVVDYLLGDLKHKLLFCWDAFHCTETRFRAPENRRKFIVFKDLRKLWEKHDPTLLWKKGDYDESNTLLLDDSPYKALLNPMHTGVFPPSYSHKTISDNSLGPGGDIRAYLEGLAMAENVQHYVAEHQFGQSAINDTNPRWNYYSKAVQSLPNRSAKRV